MAISFFYEISGILDEDTILNGNMLASGTSFFRIVLRNSALSDLT
jgi:hypothetical protein